MTCFYSEKPFNVPVCVCLPGHSLSLQLSVSLPDPLQFDPPCAGVGLSQTRSLVLVPFPQVTEHDVKLPQSPHSPSTGNNLLKVFEPIVKIICTE